MKQRFSFLLFTVIIVLASCKSGSEETPGGGTTDTIPVKTESAADACCDAWKKFKNDNKEFKLRFDVPLAIEIVEECIREYREKLGANPPNVTDVKFTYSVAFETNALNEWLMVTFPKCDQVKMEFGIYTQKAIDLSRKYDASRHIPQSHLNKTTVFISPYMMGTRAVEPGTTTQLESFNLGSLHP